MKVLKHIHKLYRQLPTMTPAGWQTAGNAAEAVTNKVDLDLFLVETPGGDYILEWSGPTRDQCGQAPYRSIRAAFREAERLFGVSSESWRNGDLHGVDADYYNKDRFRPQLTSPDRMGDLWPYFNWTATETLQLVGLLRGELSHRRRKFEAEMDQYGAYDPDERQINRNWCVELTAVLRRWSALLEISADDMPGYRKAARINVWNEGLIEIEPITDVLAKTLGSRSASSAAIFRPLCLERADGEIMKWLAFHPKDVDRLHHRTFEAIVAEVVREAGWVVELTKRTRDGGYDLLCLRNDLAGIPVKIVVEVKLYDLRRPVGLPMVDRLMGVSMRTGARQAVLVTNSRFSRDAWKLWEERVRRDLVLIDREELLEWLSTGKAQI